MTRTAWGCSIGINDLIHEQDRSSTVPKAREVTVHFGDVTARCEEFIRASEEIVCAVAWVRSPRLVRALAERPVALIVNKEFALRRPDSKERSMLAQLHGGVRGFGATTSPVRCLGDCSRGAFTGLLHHKFLIRLERGRPVAVWTGSFNLTSGAGGNFENAVDIDDRVWQPSSSPSSRACTTSPSRSTSARVHPRVQPAPGRLPRRRRLPASRAR